MIIRNGVEKGVRGVILWGALAVFCCSTALASSKVHLKPGLWEFDMVLGRPGIAAIPLQSKKCLTPKMIKGYENGKPQLPPQLKSQGCRITQNEHKGTHIKQKIMCPGRGSGMSSEGEMKLDSPTAFHMNIHMVTTMMGHTMENTNRTKAHWIGTCNK